MPEEFKPGCQRPASKVSQKAEPMLTKTHKEKGDKQNMIKVGQKAPEFSAPAYYQGKFVNVQLSEYLGKWVSLCFYPGDFTFV